MNFMPAGIKAIPAQRAAGRLGLGFRCDAGGRTRIERFYQEGCLKARLPRPVVAAVCEAVTVNISGGIAGGDVLSTEVGLERGARAVVAGQAAERVYRALDGVAARVETRIGVGPGAVLSWLPQETILFDGFALERSLEIEMAEDASFLGVESLVFGRQAMNEAVRAGRLRDRILLRRAGRLVFEDMTRLEGDIAAALARPAVAGGNVATAALLWAAPGAVARLQEVRAALAAAGGMAGASAFDGVVFARVLAPSAASLRCCVQAALRACGDGAALPRVWQG